MTRPSTLLHPTADLRRSATDLKRDRDHKVKWAYGTRPLPGQNQEFPHRRRPDALDANRTLSYNHPYRTLPVKVTVRSDIDEAIQERRYGSDSSADEDVLEPNSAADDPNVFYSYDAPRGPAQGDQILGAALNQAVEKFEHKETEKLVREYEFVPRGDPSEYGDGDGYTADDDFEIVEPMRQ